MRKNSRRNGAWSQNYFQKVEYVKWQEMNRGLSIKYQVLNTKY